MADSAGDVLRDEKLMRALWGLSEPRLALHWGLGASVRTWIGFCTLVLQLLWGLSVLGSHVPKASILARGDSLARPSVSWGLLMFAEWTDCRRVGSLGTVGAGGLAGAGRGRKGFRGLLCAAPPTPAPACLAAGLTPGGWTSARVPGLPKPWDS